LIVDVEMNKIAYVAKMPMVSSLVLPTLIIGDIMTSMTMTMMLLIQSPVRG